MYSSVSLRPPRYRITLFVAFMGVDPDKVALAWEPAYQELLLGDPLALTLDDPRPHADPLAAVLAAESAVTRLELSEVVDLVRALPVLERR